MSRENLLLGRNCRARQQSVKSSQIRTQTASYSVAVLVATDPKHPGLRTSYCCKPVIEEGLWWRAQQWTFAAVGSDSGVLEPQTDCCGSRYLRPSIGRYTFEHASHLHHDELY